MTNRPALVCLSLVVGCGGDAGGGGAGPPAGSGGAAGAGGAGGLAGAAACPEADAPVRARVAERLAGAASDLAATARVDASTSCVSLARALGCVTSDASLAPDDLEVKTRCGDAEICLGARALAAGATTLTGGKCESPVGLYVACEDECADDADCADVCRAVVEVSAFCVAPKLSQAPSELQSALAVSLPLLHGDIRRLVPLGQAALDRASTRADTWLEARGSACSTAGRKTLLDAAESLAATRQAGERVLLAAGVAP